MYALCALEPTFIHYNNIFYEILDVIILYFFSQFSNNKETYPSYHYLKYHQTIDEYFNCTITDI